MEKPGFKRDIGILTCAKVPGNRAGHQRHTLELL